jgi:transposase-like protein
MSMQETGSRGFIESPVSGEYPVCHRCNRSMTVRQLTPSLLGPDVDDVVYRCTDCGSVVTRAVKS